MAGVKDVIRGQFNGRGEKVVSPNSPPETFAALGLGIDCWRWKGATAWVVAGTNSHDKTVIPTP